MSPRLRMAVVNDDETVRRRWRDHCMRTARAVRRDLEEAKAAGSGELVDQHARRMRFWVIEARLWNRALWKGPPADAYEPVEGSEL